MHLHLFYVSILILHHIKICSLQLFQLTNSTTTSKKLFFRPIHSFFASIFFVFIYFFYQKTEKLLPKHIITFRVNVKINRTTSVENTTNSNKKKSISGEEETKIQKKLFHSSSLFVHVVLDIDHKLNFILL